MVGRGSGAQRNRLQHSIHAAEETIHPDAKAMPTHFLGSLGSLGICVWKTSTREREQLFLLLVLSCFVSSFGQIWPPEIWDKDVAHVQPALSNRPVSTGDPVGHHVCVIGHFDFPAPVSARCGEGASSSSSFHLLDRTGSCLGRPDAGLHGALCSVPHS